MLNYLATMPAVIMKKIKHILTMPRKPPERRQRWRKREHIDSIALAYRAGALSAPQAGARLREWETPIPSIHRILGR